MVSHTLIRLCVPAYPSDFLMCACVVKKREEAEATVLTAEVEGAAAASIVSSVAPSDGSASSRTNSPTSRSSVDALSKATSSLHGTDGAEKDDEEKKSDDRGRSEQDHSVSDDLALARAEVSDWRGSSLDDKDGPDDSASDDAKAGTVSARMLRQHKNRQNFCITHPVALRRCRQRQSDIPRRMQRSICRPRQSRHRRCGSIIQPGVRTRAGQRVAHLRS